MSLTPTDLIDIVSTNFFGGDTTIAGLIIFSIVIIGIFVLTKHALVGFISMIPITLVFSYLHMLPDTLMIILIVVSVLGIAITGRKATGDDL